MAESKETPKRFFGYPNPVEAPTIVYKKSEDSNPVFRGTILVIGAWLVSKLPFLQKILWTNAGFGSLRTLDLDGLNERWDPTVIPISSSNAAPTEGLDLEFIPNLPADTPGRYHSIIDYHAKYLSGELTPLAVAESLLPLIRRDVTPRSHHSTSFISTNPDLVLAAAKASTDRYKAGKPIGVLDGVPSAVKDESDVSGYRSTFGRKTNDSLFKIADTSSWPVQKLQEAGVVILGKLNMHELGADTTNNNPNYGTPLNPHNSNYYTGGSSGGAAYSVAAGLIPFALAADGGGSIRIPSSFCGIYGLKPSHSRLEDTGSTVTVTGPLAANMSDLEISYRTMAVPSPTSHFPPPSPSLPENKNKILGICKPWNNRADASVKTLCDAAVEHFKQKGYQVIDIDLPHLPPGQLAHAFTILSEMAVRARSHTHPSHLTALNPANKVLLTVGSQTPALDYHLAQQLRQMLMQHLAFLYQQYPGLLIVSPTTPMPGWPIASPGDLKHGITDGNTSIRNMEYVWLANFCGNPAISVPVGYVEPTKGEGRVPVGMMAMAEWGGEEQLLGWGYEAEGFLNGNGRGGGRQRAANWYDGLGVKV